jgi:hypothetical protein
MAMVPPPSSVVCCAALREVAPMNGWLRARGPAWWLACTTCMIAVGLHHLHHLRWRKATWGQRAPGRTRWSPSWRLAAELKDLALATSYRERRTARRGASATFLVLVVDIVNLSSPP